jgi:hypothetical protein
MFYKMATLWRSMLPDLAASLCVFGGCVVDGRRVDGRRVDGRRVDSHGFCWPLHDLRCPLANGFAERSRQQFSNRRLDRQVFFLHFVFTFFGRVNLEWVPRIGT